MNVNTNEITVNTQEANILELTDQSHEIAIKFKKSIAQKQIRARALATTKKALMYGFC